MPRLPCWAIALLLGCAQHVPAQPRVERVGEAIHFSGQINAQTVAAFLRLLDEGAVSRLVIDSRGGHVGPALDMAEAVHQRQLDVEVPSACHSSCANYVFPAGRAKILGRIAAVAWHGNMTHVLYLQQTGQGRWSEPLIEDARQLALREQQFFRRIGVDGFVCWFGKIAPYGVEGMYSLALEDMERFGIRQVSLRDAPVVPGAGPVPLRVDWATLDAFRPMVSLERPAGDPGLRAP